MREPIWKKDDFFFFNNGGKRYDMDASVVELPETVMLETTFYTDAPPIVRITDIRLEDGEISGEVTLFDDANVEMWDEIKTVYRLGGCYRDVKYANEERTVLSSCILAGVALVPHENSPANGNPGARVD